MYAACDASGRPALRISSAEEWERFRSLSTKRCRLLTDWQLRRTAGGAGAIENLRLPD
jgi:hypothetical protein